MLLQVARLSACQLMSLSMYGIAQRDMMALFKLYHVPCRTTHTQNAECHVTFGFKKKQPTKKVAADTYLLVCAYLMFQPFPCNPIEGAASHGACQGKQKKEKTDGGRQSCVSNNDI